MSFLSYDNVTSCVYSEHIKWKKTQYILLANNLS